MLAKLLLVQLDQLPAMSDFLLAHLFEHLRCGGEAFPQVLAAVGVDAFVLLFQRNRQSQNLLLRKAMKALHGRDLPRCDSSEVSWSARFSYRFLTAVA